MLISPPHTCDFNAMIGVLRTIGHDKFITACCGLLAMYEDQTLYIDMK